MRRLLEILAWRSRQLPLVRWGGVIFLFLAAVSARLALGSLHGANPAVIFYPAILLASVLLGWKEALLLLGLVVGTGAYLFLPPGMYLLPIGWILVGSLNIAIIAALSAVADELVAANRRQRVLFLEVQHRVANTLQAVVGTLDIARRRMASSPVDAVQLMENAAQRFAASADVHRRLSDPALFQRSLKSILQVAVSTVIDDHIVGLTFDVDEIDLNFHQMSTITMLVLEVASNSQKYVFRQGLGSSFLVSLKALPDGQAMLTIRDDGPGLAQNVGCNGANQRLGLGIMRDLAAELDGTLNRTPGAGAEIVVVFSICR